MMYYFIYALLYLLSLLPFKIIYFLGDGCYALIYYIIGYRKKVVFQNLQIAFPEKTEKERKRIAKDFYHGLVDTFIEAIKLISMKKENFGRYIDGNIEVVNELAKKGKNIQLQGGHHFNWEYANWFYAMKTTIPFYGIYMPISNKSINKIFYDIRARYGTRLLSATEFKNKREALLQQQYVIGVVADQSPSGPAYAYWLNFFDRPTAFITGPARAAVKNNIAIVFVRFIKKKRGHYYLHHQLVTENASELTEKELTMRYRDFIEESIKTDPSNFLWTHRRWKWEYKDEYQHLWIDNKAFK